MGPTHQDEPLHILKKALVGQGRNFFVIGHQRSNGIHATAPFSEWDLSAGKIPSIRPWVAPEAGGGAPGPEVSSGGPALGLGKHALHRRKETKTTAEPPKTPFFKYTFR